MKATSLRGLGAFAAVLLLSTAAQAFEPTGNAVADAFLNSLEAGDTSVTSIGTVTENGDTVTIDSIELTGKDNKLETSKIAKTIITDGEILDNGRLKMQDLTLDDILLSSGDGTMQTKHFDAKGLILPSPKEVAETTSGDKIIGPVYDTVDITGVTFTDDDKTHFTIRKISASIDGRSGDFVTSGSFRIEGIEADADKIGDDAAKELQKLGYSHLDLSASGSGTWDFDTGIAKISDLTINGPHMVSLSISLELVGLTKDTVEKLTAAQGDTDKSMAAVQGTSVNNIRIHLKNDSLVDRLLDKQAKDSGTSREDLVKQISSSLPMMLSMLKNEAFEKKVADSVTTFLEDPKSLTIEAKPANPVPFAMLMGTAMMAPQTLPQVLGVGIHANDD